MTVSPARYAASVAEMRKNFVGSPNKPPAVWKSIEQDITDNRSDIAALRADVTALTDQSGPLALGRRLGSRCFRI